MITIPPKPAPRLLAGGSAVILLLSAGFAIQANFFVRYPQPILFGDPAGYYAVAQRLREAAALVAGGASFSEAFDHIRSVLHFFGVGLLYTILPGERPRDLAGFRLLLAGFNTAGMLGSFLLARRLSRSFVGGLAALVFAVLHPTFATHTGRLYPDAVTGCLCVFSAVLYARGLDLGSRRSMAGAGFLLMCGLLVRPQLTNYVLLVAAPLVLWWWRSRSGRHLAPAFALGCLPLLLLWTIVLRTAGGPVDARVPGWNIFRPYYPYGFWQNMETDGWDGPYRLKTEPFYQEMEKAAQGDPDLLRSRPRQIAFTFRYVTARPLESLLLVLDNAYRLYDRPANPYQWDYPLDHNHQVLLHRLVVVLFLAGLAVVAAEIPARSGAFFIPLVLAVIHAFSLPWARYALPGLFVVLAGAGTFVGWFLRRFRAAMPRPRIAAPLLIAIASAVVLAATPRLLLAVPSLARWLGPAAALGLLATPFALATALAPGRRMTALAFLVFGGLATLLGAHVVRDELWHTVELPLGERLLGAEQEIALGPEALHTLRSAGEAFLVFDLSVPGDAGAALAVEVGGMKLPGGLLIHTMPRLAEATITGGRLATGYAQWWALPFGPELLPPPGEPLRVRLRVRSGARVTLRADRFADQDRVYRGPAFGDFPHVIAGKLEYDGDYRIPVRVGLGSRATRSAVLDAARGWVATPVVHRIRLITLAANEGRVVWETAPLPAVPALAIAFAATTSGGERSADLLVNEGAILRFPLGADQDFEMAQGPYRLCYRFEGRHGANPRGSYFLFGPFASAGASLRLTVRFRTGMRDEPMSFGLDRRVTLDDLRDRLARCAPPRGTVAVQGVGRLVDIRRNNYPDDTGRWCVAKVY